MKLHNIQNGIYNWSLGHSQVLKKQAGKVHNNSKRQVELPLLLLHA